MRSVDKVATSLILCILSYGILAEISLAFAECFQKEDAEAILNILEALARVERFSLEIDFLEKREIESVGPSGSEGTKMVAHTHPTIPRCGFLLIS